MNCPEDFSLDYSWQSGSVPPPYYYEYTITLHSDGHGQVTLLPDYPQHQPHARTEEFSVSAAEMDRLCDTLHTAGLFETTWRDVENGSVGGDSACLTVRASGHVIHVPYQVSLIDGLRVAPVYEAIRALAAEALDRLLGAPGMVK